MMVECKQCGGKVESKIVSVEGGMQVSRVCVECGADAKRQPEPKAPETDLEKSPEAEADDRPEAVSDDEWAAAMAEQVEIAADEDFDRGLDAQEGLDEEE